MLHTIDQSQNEIISINRERFHHGLPLQENHPVRPDILASWRHCQRLRVDPYAVTSRLIPSEEFQAICQKNKVLLDVAIPAVNTFYENIRGSDTNMLITDISGVILHSRGGGSGFNGYPSCAVRGLDGSFQMEGTTAMNLCLSEGRPVSVSGAEHYKSTYDNWHCTAAPIHDSSGTVIGCVALVVHRLSSHIHTFGMAATLSSAISEQLKLRMLLEDHRTILELINEAVIVIDNKNRIKEINVYACKLFNTNVPPLGSKVDSIINNNETIEKLRQKAPVCDADTTFTLNNGTQLHCSLSASRTTDGGLIINLREQKRIQHLAKVFLNATAKYHFDDILGESLPMRQAKDLAQAAGRHDSSVLILGESGVGKELFAQAIHNASVRKKGPFVAINCGAIPRDLVQSELFGYEQGAFTGASREGKIGKFEMAEGGTLFLDEIGDMPLNMQVNLLRVLEEGTVTRIGGKVQRKVDVRVIAATHHNLVEEIKSGTFRRDLYYRLNVICIAIPPLRDRTSDVALLAKVFLERYQTMFHKQPLSFDPAVLDILEQYPWQGNVRELENVIERAVIVAQGSTIQKQDLPLNLLARVPPQTNTPWRQNNKTHTPQAKSSLPEPTDNDATAPRSHTRSYKEREKLFIIQTLTETQGNLRSAAKILGLSRGTIYARLKQYGLTPEVFRS